MCSISALFDIIVLPFFVFAPQNENTFRRPWSTKYVHTFFRDGVGRSGVFCALWSVTEKIRSDAVVDVFQAAKRLRACRQHMIGTLVTFYAILICLTLAVLHTYSTSHRKQIP